jgi:UDP-glucuronate 4-epimerase
MKYQETIYEVINLGESETVELSRLIHLLEEALGKRAVRENHPAQAGDVPVTLANIDKARRLLGYNPKTKIEDGILKFVAWFKTTPKQRDSRR